jgi:hypothetical protein
MRSWLRRRKLPAGLLSDQQIAIETVKRNSKIGPCMHSLRRLCSSGEARFPRLALSARTYFHDRALLSMNCRDRRGLRRLASGARPRKRVCTRRRGDRTARTSAPRCSFSSERYATVNSPGMSRIDGTVRNLHCLGACGQGKSHERGGKHCSNLQHHCRAHGRGRAVHQGDLPRERFSMGKGGAAVALPTRICCGCSRPVLGPHQNRTARQRGVRFLGYCSCDLLPLSLSQNDPGCVKTHTFMKCRKYNSPTPN